MLLFNAVAIMFLWAKTNLKHFSNRIEKLHKMAFIIFYFFYFLKKFEKVEKIGYHSRFSGRKS